MKKKEFKSLRGPIHIVDLLSVKTARRRGSKARLACVGGSRRSTRRWSRACDRQECRAQNAVVHQLGTLRLREHKPDNRKRLERVVEGEPVQDKVHECLNKVEEAKHHPVRKPLDVVLWLGRLESVQREVHRDEEADEVRQETGEAEIMLAQGNLQAQAATRTYMLKKMSCAYVSTKTAGRKLKIRTIVRIDKTPTAMYDFGTGRCLSKRFRAGYLDI